MKIFLILLCFIIPCNGQVITKIYPQDGDDYHTFGYKLSLDSVYFVVSSRNGSLGAGAVYVYNSDSIKFIQKILPDTSYFGYRFGSPVLLSDTLLFIGATKKVHIYKKINSTFQSIKILTPFDPAETEQYGRAISEYNKSLFIGAYLDGPLDIGAAYYYEYDKDSGWVFLQKIYPSSAERHAQFGSRLWHNDKYAVISAPGDGFQSGPMRGAALLYEKTDSGWIERQKILPTDSTYYQLFGIDLAIDGKRIAIGVTGSILNQNYNGRIYIYEINEMGLAEIQDSIFASDNFPGNNFGRSFRLKGDSLFAGASGNQYMSANSKMMQQKTYAYLFVKTKNGWEEKRKFEPTVQDPSHVFGYAVDFLDGNFLVGSPGDPVQGLQSGSVYLFQPNIGSVIKDDIIPTGFYLSQNYPNPFNPTTTIKYSLPKSGIVQLKVYDILGQEIKTKLNEYKQAGTYYIEFDAGTLPSGVYFYRLKSGHFVETKKMLLLR